MPSDGMRKAYNLVALALMAALLNLMALAPMPSVFPPNAMAQQPSLTQQLDAAVAELAAQLPAVEGTIGGFERGGKIASLLVNDGRSLRPGSELVITRLGPMQIHPVTKERLGRFEELVGVASVNQSLPKIARARLFVAGGAKVAVGDRVAVPDHVTILMYPVQNSSQRLLNERSFNSLLAAAIERHDRFTVQTLVAGEERSRGSALDALFLGRQYQLLLQPLVREKGGDELSIELRLISLMSQRGIALVSMPISRSELEVAPAPAVAVGPRAGGQLGVPLVGPAQRASLSGTGELPTRALRHPDIIFARGYTNNAPPALQNGGAPPLRVQEMPRGLVSFDVGDLDGDDTPELVAASSNKLFVYRWEAGKFKLITTMKGHALDSYLSVDIADINGNGRSEVFVTNLVSQANQDTGFENELRSFVLETRGGKLKRIWRKAPFFFRVLRTPERPEGILLSQRHGSSKPYEGPINELRWNGRDYVRSPKFSTPEGFQIYGFTLADLNGDDAPEIVIIGDDGFLRIFTPSGQVLFESEESLGVNNFNKIEMNPPESDIGLNEQASTESSLRALSQSVDYPLKFRLRVFDFDGNGLPEVIALANPPSQGLSRFRQNRKSTVGGNIIAYGWTGASFAKLWETRRKRDLHFMDFALLDVKKNGLPVALMLSFQKKFIGRGPSSLQMMNFF